MRSIFLALTLAIGAPVLLGGCDKLKELTGDSKSQAKKDDDDDDDDKKKQKKKKDKETEKDDGNSAKADNTAGPSSPVVASGSASSAHMPSGCQVVITANLAKLMAHPAVEKEIVPLLEEILANPAPKNNGTKKLQEFMKVTGISLKNIHNAAFCAIAFTPGTGGDSFAMAVGGDIKPDSIIPALEKSNLGFNPIEVDGRKALSGKDGEAGGQFADGVVGLATSVEIYKAMSAPGAAGAAHRIDPSRELSFSLSEGLLKKSLRDDKKTPEPMKAVKTASGFIDLTGGKAEARLVTGSPDEAKKLDGLVALLAGEFEKDQKPGSLEELLFKTVKSRVEGNDVVIELPIPELMLTQGAALLAAELKKAKATL